jgi:hypothetical protein
LLDDLKPTSKIMNKAQKIIAWILTGISALLIVSSGIAKLTGAKDVVEGLTKYGLGPYIPFLGVMEIVFALFFLFPQTIKIGFILISCYFAGALATDLSHGGNIAAPIVILALVWIASFLRNQNIFLNTSKA